MNISPSSLYDLFKYLRQAGLIDNAVAIRQYDTNKYRMCLLRTGIGKQFYYLYVIPTLLLNICDCGRRSIYETHTL